MRRPKPVNWWQGFIFFIGYAIIAGSILYGMIHYAKSVDRPMVEWTHCIADGGDCGERP